MGTIRFESIQPPEGCEWCAVCAALVKGWIIGQHPDEISQAKAPGQLIKIETADHEIPDELYPQVAVAHGVTQLPVGMPDGTVASGPAAAPLCWTHLTGVVASDSMLVPASAAQMPRGGPVLLGQKRG